MAQKWPEKIEKRPQIPFFRHFWAILSPFRAEGHFLFSGQFFSQFWISARFPFYTRRPDSQSWTPTCHEKSGGSSTPTLLPKQNQQGPISSETCQMATTERCSPNLGDRIVRAFRHFLRGSSSQVGHAIACRHRCENGGEGSCGGVGAILLFSPTVWAGSGESSGTHTHTHTHTQRGTNTHTHTHTRTHTNTHRNVQANIAPTFSDLPLKKCPKPWSSTE